MAKKPTKKKAPKQEHRYVNLQTTSTMVPGLDGRRITVSSWNKRHGNVASGAVFVVEGEHYAQFVSAKGPLYPFPRDADDKDRAIPSGASQPVAPPVAAPAASNDGGGDAGDAPAESSDGAGDAPDGDGADDQTDGDDAASGDEGEGEKEAEAEEAAPKAKSGSLKKKAAAKKKKKKS
jgi:hypothetical protein